MVGNCRCFRKRLDADVTVIVEMKISTFLKQTKLTD